MGVFNFCSCSCCSRRTPRTRCVFANATFTGGRATAKSHEYRSRGAVLSCRVRWHMRGGIRVPCHARTPQQREQRSRFLHCVQLDAVALATRLLVTGRHAMVSPCLLVIGCDTTAGSPLPWPWRHGGGWRSAPGTTAGASAGHALDGTSPESRRGHKSDGGARQQQQRKRKRHTPGTCG